MKIIGIDVGGTNADGVVLENGNIATKAKLSVDQENLSDLIITLLEMLQKGSDVKDLSQLHLSTTLCTNALVGNRLDPVGMLIQAGPGMNPEFLDCGDYKIFLDGAIDHRGRVIKKPSPEKVASALADFRNKGIESIGIVTKFSHRNPEIEQELADSARAFPRISTGNVISGLPNFPRRVYTTWLNAGLKNRFFEFEKAIQKGVKQLAIKAPIHVLKADGGTIPLEQASLLPCESIYSGPSASVMGALALTPRSSDFIVLDIGGTTTDIGLFADRKSVV